MTDTSGPVITDSAAGMAALLGAQVDPATGALTTLPGTQAATTPPTEPAAAAAATAAEIVELTGPEAIARVNELLAAQSDLQAQLTAKEAEANDWKAQSRRNERAKREARKLLKENGVSAGVDDTDDTGVHTDDQDDDDTSAASTLRQENLRLRVAFAAGLDVSDADRLRGTTEAELKADAEAFKKRLAPSMRPGGRADGGAGVTLKVLTPAQEMAAAIGKALSR